MKKQKSGNRDERRNRVRESIDVNKPSQRKKIDERDEAVAESKLSVFDEQLEEFEKEIEHQEF